jgi:hypothetical protein
VEAECGRKLRVLRTDNGDEFTAAEFVSYCADEGVQRHYSAPYCPQQNGVVERRNQTVVGMARALLKQRGMPTVFWGEAVVTAVSHLRVFGCLAFTKELGTSVSSTTGAPQGCSLATRMDQRPITSLTQEHCVCARRAM